MPPVGEGANQAMLDAAELAGQLAANPADPHSAIRTYEEAMFTRIHPIAEMSARVQSMMLSPTAAEDIIRFFTARLTFQADVSDVYAALASGQPGFVLLDSRSGQAWRQGHIPRALHLPTAAIPARASDLLDLEVPVITYCWGPGCDGATRAALALARLGYRVKEMIGGIEYWIREGFEALEPMVRPGPYAFGSAVTLVDICLVPQVYNARRLKVPLDRFPKLVAIDAACAKLAAFDRARPENQPDAE